MRKTKLLALVLALALAVPFAFAGTENTPSHVTAELQDKIYHAKVFDHGTVQATYENGVATLTGTVDNLGSKLDAERAARKVKGVTRVVNNIRVFAEDVSPRQMLDRARHEVLIYYAYGIFDNVQLQAKGDKLIVSGQVTQPFKKSDLGHILARVRGVAALQNNLEVLPLSTYDDQLRIELARAIYGRSGFELYAVQANPPIHIIVKNGHVTLEGAVKDNMDKTLAGISARTVGLSFSVTNNLRVDKA
jgi:hyperosmotically inducible protein